MAGKSSEWSTTLMPTIHAMALNPSAARTKILRLATVGKSRALVQQQNPDSPAATKRTFARTDDPVHTMNMLFDTRARVVVSLSYVHHSVCTPPRHRENLLASRTTCATCAITMLPFTFGHTRTLHAINEDNACTEMNVYPSIYINYIKHNLAYHASAEQPNYVEGSEHDKRCHYPGRAAPCRCRCRIAGHARLGGPAEPTPRCYCPRHYASLQQFEQHFQHFTIFVCKSTPAI